MIAEQRSLKARGNDEQGLYRRSINELFLETGLGYRWRETHSQLLNDFRSRFIGPLARSLGDRCFSQLTRPIVLRVQLRMGEYKNNSYLKPIFSSFFSIRLLQSMTWNDVCYELVYWDIDQFCEVGTINMNPTPILSNDSLHELIRVWPPQF